MMIYPMKMITPEESSIAGRAKPIDQRIKTSSISFLKNVDHDVQNRNENLEIVLLPNIAIIYNIQFYI